MGGARKVNFVHYAAFSQRVNLISSSVVNFPFNSLELLQFVSGSATIPASITNATLHLLLESGENEVFFSIGLWSLNDSLASAGCVEPGLDTIAPGQDIGWYESIRTQH